MCAIPGAPCPRPGLRVSRVSGSYEGRVASCRVQLLLLHSGGGSNCKRFQISRCSGARHGGFSGAANRGLIISSSNRKLYAPGLRDDEGCGRWFGRKDFAVAQVNNNMGLVVIIISIIIKVRRRMLVMFLRVGEKDR